MSYNKRGPPGSNGRRPELQQYSPALTARTQDYFSASTAQNSYNRDSALTARTQDTSSASTAPNSYNRYSALTARSQTPSASTTRSQQASSTSTAHDTQPGHAGENGHPSIDIESSSPNRIYALLRRHGLIEITERVGASDLKFRVVDDRAHDALVKLLRENFIRIISGGFQIQEPPRPQRPTPSQNMQHLGLGLIAASQRVEAMSSIIIELWDIYALIPLASAMETAGQCCGGEPSKDTKLELGKTENSPPAEVATLMVGMLRGAENMACHMGRLSKEDSRACGHLAWHSEYLRGMLRELLVLGWYMERGRDDLVERWRLDHDMGRPQPSGHALR